MQLEIYAHPTIVNIVILEYAGKKYPFAISDPKYLGSTVEKFLSGQDDITQYRPDLESYYEIEN